MSERQREGMPRHDPIPSPPHPSRPGSPAPDPDSPDRNGQAWRRYRRLMIWMAAAATVAVLIALLYLKSMGTPLPLPMVIATIAGVGLSVLLGTALMGLVFLSNNSGHDQAASGRDERSDEN